MSVVVITPPGPIVSLEEAKRHLRVEHGDDDAYITDLVAVAQGDIDGPHTWFGRAVGEQVLEVTARVWGRGIVLPCPPVVAIESVSYYDPAGAAQTLDLDDVLLDCGHIAVMVPGLSWPGIAARSDAIRLRYRAGYPPTTDAEPKPTVPAPIRHAVLLMVGRLYAQRGEAVQATLKDDPTCERLLAPYRVWGC